MCAVRGRAHGRLFTRTRQDKSDVPVESVCMCVTTHVTLSGRRGLKGTCVCEFRM